MGKWKLLTEDTARAGKDHPLEGARIAVREGYPKLAPLILRHHDLSRNFLKQDIPGGLIPEADYELETKILYLADKHLQGTRREQSKNDSGQVYHDVQEIKMR